MQTTAVQHSAVKNENRTLLGRRHDKIFKSNLVTRGINPFKHEAQTALFKNPVRAAL
jgi:hypothetical protein